MSQHMKEQDYKRVVRNHAARLENKMWMELGYRRGNTRGIVLGMAMGMAIGILVTSISGIIALEIIGR